MTNSLITRGLTVSSFKKKYPRLYNKILKKYGGRQNIFDVQAAICLFLDHQDSPVCEICNSQLTIISKFRNFENAKYRCNLHVNTNNIISLETLKKHNIHNYELINVPKFLSSTQYIEVNCQKHGVFFQIARNFIKGMRCQKCYGDTILPRITFEEWISRSIKEHNNFYIYDNSKFVDINSSIEIVCPIHGSFLQVASVHMRGHGCKKCGFDRNAKKILLTTPEFILKAQQIHGLKYDYSQTIYNSAREIVDIVCQKHGKFSQVAYYHLAGNGCKQCGIQITTNKSAAEYEIINFLTEIGVDEINHSWRDLGFEIDIYLPKFNLAIEYNGIYWHSSSSKETDLTKSKQHLNKTKVCEENGIQLLHILDLEWKDIIKQEIWKSTIRHHLKKASRRIFARHCKIILLSGKDSKEFFEQNHLQGYATGSIHIGLVYKQEIVSVATFGKSRFRKNLENYFELIRFASVLNTSVIGGFSKIINEFKKTHTGMLISYANRRWSKGNVYKQCNFTLTHVTDPCYYYTDCKKIWHRSFFQKRNLANLLINYNHNLTEIENMYFNKYRRIWDCGHLVFEMQLNNKEEKTS